jgi:hypothetical protein
MTATALSTIGDCCKENKSVAIQRYTESTQMNGFVLARKVKRAYTIEVGEGKGKQFEILVRKAVGLAAELFL